MEFFDKIGKKASEAYKITADKTGKIAKETKIKLKINELKAQVNDIYKEIGKKVYEKHTREEEISIKKDLEEQCTKIDVLSDEIDSLLKQCLELKDKKQCPNCYKEIEKENKFCPNCGEKQNEEPPREVEILEDSEIEKDNAEETEIIKEYLQEDIKNSNQNEQEENDVSQKENENYEEKEKTNLEKTVAIEADVEVDKKIEK